MHTDREGPGDGPVDAAGADDGAPAVDAPAYDYGTSPASPATGVRGSTTPRAVLRPIPEGFPTPPPRRVPRRRPERVPDPEPARRGRGPLLAAIVLGAVVVLVLGVGGLVLAVRGLGGQDAPGAAGSPSAAEAPADEDPSGAAPGEATVGGFALTEERTEVGVRRVGSGSVTREPEGEYVIVTVEVENRTDVPLDALEGVRLETADGELHSPDRQAGQVLVADSHAFGITPTGESRRYHKVFDVPIGSEPVSLHVSVLDEAGELPLGG